MGNQIIFLPAQVIPFLQNVIAMESLEGIEQIQLSFFVREIENDLGRTPPKDAEFRLIPIRKFVGLENNFTGNEVWKFKAILITLCFVSGRGFGCCKFFHTSNLPHFRSGHQQNL